MTLYSYNLTAFNAIPEENLPPRVHLRIAPEEQARLSPSSVHDYVRLVNQEGKTHMTYVLESFYDPPDRELEELLEEEKQIDEIDSRQINEEQMDEEEMEENQRDDTLEEYDESRGPNTSRYW